MFDRGSIAQRLKVRDGRLRATSRFALYSPVGLGKRLGAE